MPKQQRANRGPTPRDRRKENENVPRNKDRKGTHLSGCGQTLRCVVLARPELDDREGEGCAGARQSLQEISSLEQGVAFRPPLCLSLRGGRRWAPKDKTKEKNNDKYYQVREK
jgi:hypothetical protein